MVSTWLWSSVPTYTRTIISLRTTTSKSCAELLNPFSFIFFSRVKMVSKNTRAGKDEAVFPASLYLAYTVHVITQFEEEKHAATYC